MNTAQDFRAHLEAFQANMETMRRLHEQAIAMRYRQSLQSALAPVQQRKRRVRLIVTQMRHITSRGLHALANLVEPERVRPTEASFTEVVVEGVYRVVDEPKQPPKQP